MIRLDQTLVRLLLVIPFFLVVTTTALEAQTPSAHLALTSTAASGSTDTIAIPLPASRPWQARASSSSEPRARHPGRRPH